MDPDTKIYFLSIACANKGNWTRLNVCNSRKKNIFEYQSFFACDEESCHMPLMRAFGKTPIRDAQYLSTPAYNVKTAEFAEEV